MNANKSINEMVEEWNAQAKAEGRYDGRAFWEIERKPGSVFDVPKTEKSERDLVWIRARRLELEQERARVVKGTMVGGSQNDVTHAIQEQLQGEATAPDASLS